MNTLGARAAVGSEVGREQGKGTVGQTVEAAKNVITGKDGPHQPGVAGYGSGVGTGRVIGAEELTAAEIEQLRIRSVVTNEGNAYCPVPDQHVPKEFETRVQVIQKFPEMKTVEETHYVKEIVQEERVITVPRSRVVMEEVERIDRVPVVRQVPKERVEIVHRVVPEEKTITEMVDVIEQVEVPRVKNVPRVITEFEEKTVTVPVVTEVPVTRMVEEPTGNFCEAPAGEFVNPGNVTGPTHGLHRTTSSVSSSDDETVSSDDLVGTGVGGSTVDGTGRKKKKRGFLSKLTGH